MRNYLKISIETMFFALSIIGIFLGSQLIVGQVAQLVMGVEYVEEHMYLLTLIAYIGVAVVVYFLNSRQKQTYLQVYRGFNKKMFLQTIAYTVPLWLSVTLINGLLYPFYPQYDTQVQSLFISSEPVLRFMVLVIGAPFVEEYLFREKILTFTKERFGSKIAIAFQGILFGIIHPFGLQKIYASVMGIGLGWMKEKTGHLLSPTIVHIIINGVGFLAGLMS